MSEFLFGNLIKSAHRFHPVFFPESRFGEGGAQARRNASIVAEHPNVSHEVFIDKCESFF